MADKEYKNILIEREGNITFLWLNRPDKRNAMSPDLHFDMEDALTWLATDKETKVLIIGGKGEAWCAGQDLRLYFRGTQDNPEMRYKANNASHNWRCELLSQFPKPTIAMVHGYAFGGRAAAASLSGMDGWATLLTDRSSPWMSRTAPTTSWSVRDRPAPRWPHD